MNREGVSYFLKYACLFSALDPVFVMKDAEAGREEEKEENTDEDEVAVE